MKYGWLRGHLDPRDKLYRAPQWSYMDSPDRVDLRHADLEPYDQGLWSSCGANAGAAILKTLRTKAHQPVFEPSRMFIYRQARLALGEEFIYIDSGCMLRDVMKSLASNGVPPESTWDYDAEHLFATPSAAVLSLAENFQTLEYQKMSGNLFSILSCLSEGFPFIFGFTVYESFESPEVAYSGIMPSPKEDEALVGRHAVACYGYDLLGHKALVLNSWGPKWGQGGYFWMPLTYMTNPQYCDDFWTIRSME